MSLAEEAERRGRRKAKDALDKRQPLGIQVDPDGRTVITVDGDLAPPDPIDARFDPELWRPIIEHACAARGLDPDRFEVDPSIPVKVGYHEGFYTVGERAERTAATSGMHRYSLALRPRRLVAAPVEKHRAARIAAARRRKKPARPKKGEGDRWLHILLSDLQLGKADGGGTDATISRVAGSLDAVPGLVELHRPVGVVIADMGDITEGTAGCYPSQGGTVDRTLTQQHADAFDIMEMAVDTVAGLVSDVRVVFVPSNHGEFRTGKQTTTHDPATDNMDLLLADGLAKLAPHKWGDHVSVWTPPKTGGDKYVCTLDLDGVLVGWTHGHQVRGGGPGRLGALEKWWLSHRHSDRARPDAEVLPGPADCDVVFLGHGHTQLVSQNTGAWIVQCPASEGASESFTAGTGRRSTSGVLTAVTSSVSAHRLNHLTRI